MKINRLKRLKCVKVKVGMESDPDAMNGSQDINRNSSMDDNHRQIHLSVINNSVNVQATCDERTDSASTSSSLHNHSSQVYSPSNFTSINDHLRRDSFNKTVGNNSSRHSSLVNGESVLPLVHIAPDHNGPVHVPGGVPEITEQSSSVYRISTESQASHSSHQQLVEIEDAREACVSMSMCLAACPC